MRRGRHDSWLAGLHAIVDFGSSHMSGDFGFKSSRSICRTGVKIIAPRPDLHSALFDNCTSVTFVSSINSR